MYTGCYVYWYIQGTVCTEIQDVRCTSIYRLLQWLNYSEVRGGELYIGQNYSATPKPL